MILERSLRAMHYSVTRNPVITLDTGEEIQTIGDPHLGREFKTNVNLHRRGEREKSVWTTFTSLLNCGKDVVVCVGDLFDTFAVRTEVVLKAFDLVSEACTKHPKTTFIFIPGNHDLSKDKTKASSYQMFAKLCGLDCKSNLIVVLDKDNHTTVGDTLLHLTAYNPFEAAKVEKEDFDRIKKWDGEVIAFGHYDSVNIDGKGYVPPRSLTRYCTLVVSGHEHTYTENKRGKLLVTGSMQPYSHAEDPDQTTYISIDSDTISDLDTTVFKDMFVRILCDSKFVLEDKFECLSLTYKLKDSTDKKEEIEELDTTTIDIDTLTYEQSLALALELEEGLDSTYKEQYVNKILTREHVKG